MALTVVKSSPQKTTGREQYRKSKTGRAHAIDLSGHWGSEILPVRLDAIEYRVQRLTKGLEPLIIDGVTTGLDWNDVGPVLDGTIDLTKPMAMDQPLHFQHGDVIRAECKWAGRWTNIWDMRVWDPDRTLGDGAVTAQLYNDLRILQMSEDNFAFRRHKRKAPLGYRCHEILIEIARRYRIPLGQIVAGTHFIKSLEMTDASPLAAITRAYRLEREATGRRFVMRWHGGRLHVTPLIRNPIMYTLRQQIEEMTIGLKVKDSYATALTGRWTTSEETGTDAHGHKKHKRVKDHAMVTGDLGRGFVHKQVTLHGIDSRDEAVERLRHLLAGRQRVVKTAAITHALIPFLRRGDSVRVSLPEEGYYGRLGLLWVSQVNYHLQGAPTMDLQLTMEDPNKKTQADKDAEARERKRRQKAAA